MTQAREDQRAAVQRMKQYIHENVRERITAADVARAAGYSRYYAARVFRSEGTGSSAHWVEVPANSAGEIPDGFDVIELEPCQLMVFQGEPYNDDQFGAAVGACMERIETFNPEVYGYRYAPDIAPRMQLAPQGWRGYIEMRPVEAIS